MAILNRDQILSANDLQTVVIDVPEWGGKVKIRTMTGAERDEFERQLLDEKQQFKSKSLRAWLCSLCIVDEKGNRLFASADIEKLSAKSSVALDRVFSAAMELNRIGQQEIEQLEKNFEKTQGDDSALD